VNIAAAKKATARRDIEYEYWCAESFSKKQAMNAFNACLPKENKKERKGTPGSNMVNF
jgi:hypothetical protein